MDSDWLPSSVDCCLLEGNFLKQTIGCFNPQQQPSVLLTHDLCMGRPVFREAHLMVHWVLGALGLVGVPSKWKLLRSDVAALCIFQYDDCSRTPKVITLIHVFMDSTLGSHCAIESMSLTFLFIYLISKSSQQAQVLSHCSHRVRLLLRLSAVIFLWEQGKQIHSLKGKNNCRHVVPRNCPSAN